MTRTQQKIYSVQYYLTHKVERIAWQIQYNKVHRTEHNARSMRYDQAHRLEKKARTLRWCKAHLSFVNWRKMMTRCYNPNAAGYKHYGGRGIKVYKPWHEFTIYEKEFGRLKHGLGYTVDRINNNGNYQPDNVQWLTKAANRSKRWTNSKIS